MSYKKEVIINNDEVKVDLLIEKECMIICGSCMYYSKKLKKIGKLSSANICIFKNNKKIRQLKTNKCGHYCVVVPISNCYTICMCKNKFKQIKEIHCNNANFCMLHFIFDEENCKCNDK